MLELEIPGYKGSSPPTGGTKWSQLDKPTTSQPDIFMNKIYDLSITYDEII